MEANCFTKLWWFLHTSTWISHGCTRVPPSWTSLPAPSPPHNLDFKKNKNGRELSLSVLRCVWGVCVRSYMCVFRETWWEERGNFLWKEILNVLMNKLITVTFHILFFQKRTVRRIWKAEFHCEKQRSFTYPFYKKCTESHWAIFKIYFIEV